MPTTLDDVYETRRENLSRLLSEPGAKTQLAARLGASQSHITHLLKPPTAKSARAIREETARQIEDIMGLDKGRLDQPDLAAHRPANLQQFKAVKPYAKPREHAELDGRLMAAPRAPVDVRDFYSPDDIRQVAIKHRADPELLEGSFRIVLETIVERGLKDLPADKAAKMARLVYEQALVTGAVDRALVDSLIGLMS